MFDFLKRLNDVAAARQEQHKREEVERKNAEARKRLWAVVPNLPQVRYSFSHGDDRGCVIGQCKGKNRDFFLVVPTTYIGEKGLPTPVFFVAKEDIIDCCEE